jgi:hypothetical protein
MRKCLQIGHLEVVREFGDKVRITAGNIQKVRIVSVRDQLEEGRAIHFAGGTELELLVVFEFLAQEQRREQAQRIGISEVLAGIAECTLVI